jgi:hypothetical protein
MSPISRPHRAGRSPAADPRLVARLGVGGVGLVAASLEAGSFEAGAAASLTVGAAF